MLFGHDRSVGRVLADALDTVERRSLLLVTLGCRDDLTVGRLEAEAEFACLVGIQLVFRMLFDLDVLDRLIFDLSKRVVLDACNACLT